VISPFQLPYIFSLPLWNTTCKEVDIIITILFIENFEKDLLQATTVILIVSLFSREKPQGRLRVICFVFSQELRVYSLLLANSFALR